MPHPHPILLAATVAAVVSILLAAPPAFADGPAGATILIIRHAEKPIDGDGLSVAGEARAKAYSDYFLRYKIDGNPLKLDAIFATADSPKSRRPRLTVEPLAAARGLPVAHLYKDQEVQALANELRARAAGKNVLVCWHHGKIGELLQALGANPVAVLPGGGWPADEYDWLVELRYDAAGHVRQARCLHEGLTGSR